MKASTLFAVAMLAALPMVHANAHAAGTEPLDWMTNADGCHVLLTERECALHRQALATMTSLPQRYAYLAEQGIALQEREAMCSCKRNPPATAYYPQRKLQIARR